MLTNNVAVSGFIRVTMLASALTLSPFIAEASDIGILPEAALKAGFARPAFLDDFDAIDIDARKAQPHAWYRGLWFAEPGPIENIRVENGILTITTPNVRRFHGIATVPRNSKPGLTFRHGFFEARMRFSNDDIDWTAFWLFSRPHSLGIDSGRWCEIDVFEHFGPRAYVGTAHDWTTGGHTTNKNSYHRLQKTIDFSSWHTYGLLWQPGRLTWFLDGAEQMSAPAPAICEEQDLFLILSAQQHHEGPSVNLQVDWVRVFSE